MAKKGGIERIGDLAQFAKALKDIIKAALRGGWHAALIAALKHYWIYLVPIAILILLIPIIIICCLPAMLFGFSGSEDKDINAMTVQAETIKSYYEQYDTYCQQRVEEIEAEISSDSDSESISYELSVEGSPMDVDWFIALHSVSCGNDLRLMNEENIKDFVAETIPYTLEEKEPDSSESNGSDSSNSAHESSEIQQDSSDTSANYLLKITYLTPQQYMDIHKYSDEDRNWVELMYKTITEGETVPGEFGALFEDSSWRANITSDYGYRNDPFTGEGKLHKGIDIKMPLGTPICAVGSGTVTTARYSTSYGYHVIVDHGAGLQTLYAHCRELLVTVGDEITQGQYIGKVGSTGDSTGYHCHFEVRVNGQCVDPIGYLP